MSATPQQKTPYKIKAEFVGPIMSLDSELSVKDKNLIFATNGTGKSFLTRAFRTLDTNAYKNVDTEKIAESIVSEEANSKAGIGTFSFQKGGDKKGELVLNAKLKTANRKHVNYLYHVFSTDYIDEELKSQQYELDGNIEHEIIIGKENADLTSKLELLEQKKEKLNFLWKEWRDKFDIGKATLKSNFSINAQLGAFKSISNDYWTADSFVVDDVASLTVMQAEYDQYKTFPSEPKLPFIEEADKLFMDLTDLEHLLIKEVTVSTVGKEIKLKIQRNQNFYVHGLEQHKTNNETCPFCTQSINDVALSVIDSYQKYFEDEEARVIQKLNNQSKELNRYIEIIEDYKIKLLTAIIDFDELAKYFSKYQDKELINSSDVLGELNEVYHDLLNKIEQKKLNLAQPVLPVHIERVQKAKSIAKEQTTANVNLCNDIKIAAENIDEERKSIQRRACAVFKSRFYASNKIFATHILEEETGIIALEIETSSLQKNYGQKVSAREKVAETFSMLLAFIFGEKYSFNETDFTVKRNKKDMTRGGDRTLSDGEKSVLAFCYFIAQSHLKADTIECYKELFFIVDDPVSSLSFDYIYSIAQILKCLQIEGGDISLQQIPKSRPKLLILTHNDYLYNIARTNNIIKAESIFQLISESPSKHKFVSLKTFLTPHTVHLKHVKEVSEGKISPDYSTPNSIRSVLKSMWRFCRPDLVDFAQFIHFANNDLNIKTKSLIINELSHGGKFVSSLPVFTDIKTAADEAISIVSHFASGQLNSV